MLEGKGNRPDIEGGGETTREELPRIEVARVFLLQSKSIDIVKEEIAERAKSGLSFADIINDINFTGALLLKKGQMSMENPGQVMPVGGKKDAGKDRNRLDTAAREVFEETNLRVMQLWSLNAGNPMSYKLKHTKGDRMINVKFYVGDVTPSGITYQLNEEEDKIESFERYDLETLSELWGRGELNIEGKTHQLLDSMLPSSVRQKMLADNKEKSLASEFDVDQEINLWKTMKDLGEQMQCRETEKKANLMKHLIALSKSESDRWREELERILFNGSKDGGKKFSEVERYSAMNELFQRFVKEHVAQEKFEQRFYQALKISNLEEEIEWSGASEVESVLRLLYIIGSGKDEDVESLTGLLDAETKPLLENFIARFLDFILICSEKLQKLSDDQQKDETKTAPNLIEAYHQMRDNFLDSPDKRSNVDEKKEMVIGSVFYDVWLKSKKEKEEEELPDEIKAKRVKERIKEVHKFFRDMATGLGEIIPFGDHLGEVVELNEIERANLQKLFQYALLTPETLKKLKERFDDTGIERIVFEARRCLTLMWLTAETSYHYNEMVSTSEENVHIEDLWGGFVGGPKRKVTVRYYYEMLPDGKLSLREAQTEKAGHKLGDHSVAIEREVYIDEHDVTIRTIMLGGKEYDIYVDVRTKELEAAMRKAIVRAGRSNKPRDIYGRSIIIDVPPEDLRSETRTLIIDGKEKEVTDIVQVLDVIESLCGEVQKKNEELGENWKINIHSYVETPKEGKNYRGNAAAAAGGGGEVRFAKFYFELHSPEGKKYEEEVMIFAPTSDGKSAYYYRQQKKDDDTRFHMERLLENMGVRSFVEIIWPYGIYGEVVRKGYKKGKVAEVVARKKRKTIKKR